MKVKHEGEVHRARYMPQNHFIVATRGPQAPLYIWDFSKHPSFPETGSLKSQPQGTCIGHEGEGYGLCWSPHKTGLLVSSSEDKTVRLWDIHAAMDQSSFTNSSGTVIHPLSTFTGHTDVVEDVDWHHRDENLIGSVGDDKAIRLWDIRRINAKEATLQKLNAHDRDVNSIAFNPINEFLFATGSADSTIALWDLRNLEKYVFFILFY
jgi:WD40 repeat protein